MAFSYAQLIDYPITDVEHEVKHDDCILYALSAGLGANTSDHKQLRYLFEDNLLALPTMANVIGYPGFWLGEAETGVDWKQVLHGEQFFELHSTLPVSAKVIGKSRVIGINDKGDKGAFVYMRREIFNSETDQLICTVDQTTVCRGDGGCGGNDPAPRKLPKVPERDADAIDDQFIQPSAALLYRLNGDKNPLHVDPEVARQAGYPRPILHGLCTLAHVGHSLLKSACDYDGTRIKSMGLRFTAPVFPGEHLRTQIWHEDNGLSFQASVIERDVLVIGNGRMELN